MKTPVKYLVIILLLLLVTASGCSRQPQTGPVKVRWDKVVCVRCIMAVSDRNFAAQIRGGPAERRTKVYFFDDLGCAVLWLDEQEWQDDPRTEIWVTDYRDGTWLDARKAFYDEGNITPMDFSVGARPDSVETSLNYDQAVDLIYYREEKYH